MSEGTEVEKDMVHEESEQPPCSGLIGTRLASYTEHRDHDFNWSLFFYQ